MDALKAVIAAKHKQAQDELGGRKVAKRSQIETARLTQLREEEGQERAEQASMPLYVGLRNYSSADRRKLLLVGVVRGAGVVLAACYSLLPGRLCAAGGLELPQLCSNKLICWPAPPHISQWQRRLAR